MNNLSPVYTLKNECHDCYRCVRECRVKAIKIKDGHASVISENCIACGQCVKTCPSSAKRVRNDINKVKNLFAEKKRVFVSLAPSWAGIFDFSKEKMIVVLKKLGFHAVSETALGAQEVSIKISEILKENSSGIFISSACPAIVDYIRLYNPKFTQFITPIASPALTHAKMLKKMYGNNTSVVFIGPCIAKKSESDRYPELIDAVLTFEELNHWLKEEYINTSEISSTTDDAFLPENSCEGALYPLEGGMNDTLRQIGIQSTIQLIELSSLTALDRALKNLNIEDVTNTIFIEALACNGGCVNGPCISSRKAGISITSGILKGIQTREQIPQKPTTVLEAFYISAPVKFKMHPLEEITKAMKKIGKYNEEDELNCGGCGYATCRDLANALISGNAEPSMCVSYMRKIATRKAAAMLRCMPSAMVMVDSDLKIVEANDSFTRMFCNEMYDFPLTKADDLTGACIDRIIDFPEIFKNALKSGKDIHKEHYPIKNKIYDISAFTIEQGSIVGAIITDVTQTELNREKIAHKAQAVISKNISIVQDIACLLGEHMVETELLLTSIAQGYEIKKDNKIVPEDKS